MHFGRTDSVGEKVQPLPQDSLRTRRYLNLPLKGEGRIFLGAPVLGHQDWRGLIYPESCRDNDCLSRYSAVFNSLELNSSFYASPDEGQIDRWVRSVPGAFRFSPKIPRAISEHVGQAETSSRLKEFLKKSEKFTENLGIPFLQLPPHFSPANFAELSKLLTSVGKAHRGLAVEFRHPGWFCSHNLQNEVIDLLYRCGMYPVITDTLGKRYSLHASLTGQKVIVRFLGSNGHPTDNKRLEDWARRLKHWSDKGLDEIYFYVHQEDHGKIPQTIQQFAKLLQKHQVDLKSPALSRLINMKLQNLTQQKLF